MSTTVALEGEETDVQGWGQNFCDAWSHTRTICIRRIRHDSFTKAGFITNVDPVQYESRNVI